MNKNTFLIVVLLFITVVAKAQKIETLLMKAFTSKDSSDYYFKKAKKSIKNPTDDAEYYFCKNARCTDYNQQDSAIYYGNLVLPKFLKLKNYNKYMYVLNNLGKTYIKQGNYDKALAVYFLGIKVAEKEKNDYWVLNFTRAVSIAYHDFENYEKGVIYGKKTFKLATTSKTPDALTIAGALIAIGINFDDWNKPDSALYYHKKVFQYVKSVDTLKIGMVYNNIGNTLLKQKKYKQSAQWIQRAVAIGKAKATVAKDALYYYEYATNYNNLATIAYELKQFDKAEILFDTSYYYASRSASIEKLRDYYYHRYVFNKRRNNVGKALEFQEQYLVLRDSVFKKDRAATFAELETKYETAKKEKQLLKSKAAIAEQATEIKDKNNQFLILGLISLALLIIIYLVYRQQKLKNKQQEQEFELKTAISKIETQNKLQEQRLLISRDLHDNIGSQLTFIISSVDTIKHIATIQNPILENKLDKISHFTKDTIVELRDTIWAMNNEAITFEDLRMRILNFVEKAQNSQDTIDFKINIDANLNHCEWSSVAGMNIYRSIQEAINNALKYAHASMITIDVKENNNQVVMVVNDNGKGFDMKKITFGNGILNMQKRIESIGGTFVINSKPDAGTTIEILVNKLEKTI